MKDGNGRSAAAADWYPDPVGRHQYRYWDGTSWTDHVADDGKASVDPLAQAPGTVASTTAVAADHDSRPSDGSAHARKPRGQNARESMVREEPSARAGGTPWQAHPTVKAWLGRCHEAGYCTPDDVETLRTALGLPKYQMHDFLTDALLPELGRQGVKYRNRKLGSGSYAPPAVASLPESEARVDLSAIVRRDSSTARYMRPGCSPGAGAGATAAPVKVRTAMGFADRYCFHMSSPEYRVPAVCVACGAAAVPPGQGGEDAVLDAGYSYSARFGDVVRSQSVRALFPLCSACAGARVRERARRKRETLAEDDSRRVALIGRAAGANSVSDTSFSYTFRNREFAEAFRAANPDASWYLVGAESE